jgi:hypothetical protein
VLETQHVNYYRYRTMDKKLEHIHDSAVDNEASSVEPQEMDRREALAALGKAALVFGAAPAMTTLLTSKKVAAQSCCEPPPSPPPVP